ncbi:MAG: succinate dehydrogenase cytochrome b subunit [Myxococcaceae bacterium]
MPSAEQALGAVEERSPGFIGSTVGRKVVMAGTGVILFGFVTVHMVGNIQAYLGAASLNGYAQFLHTMLHGGGIWIFRSVLVAAVVAHIWSAASLSLASQAARPIGYRKLSYRASTFASRTMRWSGVLLAVFIVYHLLHLTLGSAHPAFDPANPYQNFVRGFQVPAASAFYLVAQLCLGLHLWHGVWSFTQTLGLVHPRYDTLRRVFASGLTVLVVGVNLSFPIAVLTGFIH